MSAAPASLAPHQADYKPSAWEHYTLAELGQWVHLLATRAQHRDNPEKAKKDLYDAGNYLQMMGAKLDALAKELA